MSDGVKINIDVSEPLQNLKKFSAKLRVALTLDAQNIAANMEEWAKINASWTDRTAHARQFLKATVSWKNSDELMIAMSHHVDYGIWLEICNEGKYAILEKAIAEFTPQFKEGWKKIVQSVGVI